jgi:2-oxoisovalerate dehydrogenase E1 component alpha subunit
MSHYPPYQHGEEASIVGSAAALAADDVYVHSLLKRSQIPEHCPKNSVLGQYREIGVLLWRGFTVSEFVAQCFGNEEDHCTKGRQMPVVSQCAISGSYR